MADSDDDYSVSDADPDAVNGNAAPSDIAYGTRGSRSRDAAAADASRAARNGERGRKRWEAGVDEELGDSDGLDEPYGEWQREAGLRRR